MTRTFRQQVLKRQKGIMCVCVELSTAGETRKQCSKNVFSDAKMFLYFLLKCTVLTDLNGGHIYYIIRCYLLVRKVILFKASLAFLLDEYNNQLTNV